MALRVCSSSKLPGDANAAGPLALRSEVLKHNTYRKQTEKDILVPQTSSSCLDVYRMWIFWLTCKHLKFLQIEVLFKIFALPSERSGMRRKEKGELFFVK